MDNSSRQDKAAQNYDLLRNFSLEVLKADLFGVADISPIRTVFFFPDISSSATVPLFP